MNVLDFVFNRKSIGYIQGSIFVFLCVLRLALPVSNLVYVSFLYTMVIFLILPISLWSSFHKTTRLFGSSYIRVRFRNTKTNYFFVNVIVNDLIIILFVVFNAFLIFCISFDFTNLSFIPYYILTVIYWLCIYLIFLGVFHFVYFLAKELKIAFFSSYAFLFILSFATDFISPSLFSYDTFDYTEISVFILVCVVIILSAHIVLYKLGKGTCEVYEEDKN